jgi:hypothetical protein
MKRNFEILRGTKEEIDGVPTKDMTIYLAWDTNELFVGNANGVKTPYNCEQRVYTWVNSVVDNLKADVYGSKGILILSPDMFEENVEEGSYSLYYETHIKLDNLTSSDWFDFKPISREDKYMLEDMKYDIFVSTENDTVTVTSKQRIEKTLYLEYFIMKGI